MQGSQQIWCKTNVLIKAKEPEGAVSKFWGLMHILSSG